MKIIEVATAEGKRSDNLRLVFQSRLEPIEKNLRILGTKDGTGKYLNCYSEDAQSLVTGSGRH